MSKKGKNAITCREWWAAAGIRAIKSAAQMAIVAIGGAITIADVEWWHVVGAAALAGLLSLLTSLGGLPEVQEGGTNVTDTAKSNSDKL